MNVDYYLLILSAGFAGLSSCLSLSGLILSNHSLGKSGFRAYASSYVLFILFFTFLTGRLLHEVHVGMPGVSALPVGEGVLLRIVYLWGEPGWQVAVLVFMIYSAGLAVYARHAEYIRGFREEFFVIHSLITGIFLSILIPLSDVWNTLVPVIPLADPVLMVRNGIVIVYVSLMFAGCAVITATASFLSSLLCSQRVEKTYSTTVVYRMLLVAWMTLTCGLAVRVWWFFVYTREPVYWNWFWPDGMLFATWALLLAAIEYVSVMQRARKWAFGFPLQIITIFVFSMASLYLLMTSGASPLQGPIPTETGTWFLPLVAIFGSGTIIVAELRGRLFSNLAATHLLSQNTLLLIRNAVIGIWVTATVTGGGYVLLTGRELSMPFFLSVLYPLVTIWLGITCLYIRESWVRHTDRSFLRRLLWNVVPVVLLTGAGLIVARSPKMMAALVIVSVLVLARAVMTVVSAVNRLRQNGCTILRAASIVFLRYPTTYSWHLVYAGIVIVILGVSLSVVNADKAVVSLEQGETVSVNGEQFTLTNVYQTEDSSRRSITAEIAVRRTNDVVKLYTRKIIYIAPYRTIAVPVMCRLGYINYRIDLEGWEDFRVMTFTFLARPFGMLIWPGVLITLIGALLTYGNQREPVKE